MGKFFDIIQAHIDAQPYPVSIHAIARRLDVTPTTVTNWRHPKKLIDKEHIVAVAHLAGRPYHEVLYALLEDIGYATPTPDRPASHVDRAVGQ